MFANDRDLNDDFEVEVSNLSPDETRGISSAFINLGTRLAAYLRTSFKVTLKPLEEDEEDDECDFDIRILDIPLDEL